MFKKLTILALLSTSSAHIAAECPTMTECASQKAACMAVAESMKSCPMTEEEMIRCGCNKPKPRSEDVEQGCMTEEEAMRCGCNKPKPRNGESVECCMTEEEMIRCGCSKPKPRTEDVEVEQVETTTTCGKCSNPKHR